MVHFPQEIFSTILSYNKRDTIKDEATKNKELLILDIDWVIGELRVEGEIPLNATMPPFMEDHNNSILFSYRPIFKYISNLAHGTSNEEFIISWVMGDGSFYSYDQEGNITGPE